MDAGLRIPSAQRTEDSINRYKIEEDSSHVAAFLFNLKSR